MEAINVETSITKKARKGGGTTSWLRELPPADYILRIESFSLFLNSKTEMYESRVFEASGYKWKLCFCPQGNKKVGVSDYISLYLKLAETEELHQGWEVIAMFKLFVFDHVRGKFLTIQDGEEFNRFNNLKTEWGYDRLLKLDAFKDETNGYLRNDCCLFGAEIYVRNDKKKGECVLNSCPDKGSYTWMIRNFSHIQTTTCSDEFVAVDWKWKLRCDPKGYGTGNGTHVSLFLYVSESNDKKAFPSGSKVYAEYKLMIKDQILGKSMEKPGTHWFSSSSIIFGFQKFLSLKDLNDKSKGYIVNDTVILEVQITLLSEQKAF